MRYTAAFTTLKRYTAAFTSVKRYTAVFAAADAEGAYNNDYSTAYP